MEIITRNTIEVEYFNMSITVPMPEAYTVHKIVINQERGSKQKKDQMAIDNIWNSLNLAEVKRLAEILTKKEQRIFNLYCAEHGLLINNH